MKKPKILSDFFQSIEPEQRLAFYFSGTTNQCLLLKGLLEETKNKISVYFFDQTKLKPNDPLTKTEQDKNLAILNHFKKKRDFVFQEIELTNLIKPSEAKNLDDPFLHIKLLKEINSYIPADAYLLSDDLSFFSNQIKLLELFSAFKATGLDLKLLTPFSNLTAQEISAEALSGTLDRFNEINLDKIYSQNKLLIDALKIFDEKKDKKEGVLDKLTTQFTCYDGVFRNLLEKQRLIDSNLFAKLYANQLSKEVIIYVLSNMLNFNPNREILITHLVTIGGLSDKEINEVLFGLVSKHCSYHKATKSHADEIDYFFRLYDYKINEETKDELMWKVYSVSSVNFYHEPILDKLIAWGCDVGDLLLRSIDGFANDKKEIYVTNLIEKYQNKIHPLQLNEALLKAFDAKLYGLCHRLISAGAKQKILQFHSHSYGWALWIKNRNKEIIANRAYWRKKDRIIIHEILKELGNPQDKVPPVIHVTGSNGKGSTCAFLRSILENNGYLVHVLTSPAIIRQNENYIIAGKEILDQQYYDYLTRAEAAFNRIKDKEDFKEKIAQANREDSLTEDQIKKDHYLDWSFIIPAITLAFAENKADATIVEVVSGGENDVTNIFNEKNTIATIINTIIFGDNHATMFGSIESAAETKSRLAKSGVPIFSVLQENAVMNVIKKTAEEKGCILFRAGSDFTTTTLDETYFIYRGFGKEFKLQKPRLAGEFQIANAAISLSALLATGKFKLNEDKVSQAIRNAYHNGRFMELDNFKVEGYERVWFGTLKTSHGIESFFSDAKIDRMDTIFMPTTNDSYDYSLSFIEKELVKQLRRVVFIHNDTNSSLSKTNSYLYDFILRKESDKIRTRKYLSSALASLQKRSFEKEGLLSLVSTGINSFNDKNVNYLGLLSQDNFEQDLRFAISHHLISTDLSRLQYEYLLNNQKLSSDDGVCEFYEKRFSCNAYNLNTHTSDEEIVIMRSLGIINKQKITVLDYGCGDGRLFAIFDKFLSLNPSSSIRLFACDISIEGLKKYQSNLLAHGFEILESENCNQKFEYDCLSILRSAKKNLEVIFVRATPNHYEDIRSIEQCDLAISIGVLPHILGKDNRSKFYYFLRFVSKHSFFTASKHNFLGLSEYFSKLRAKKNILEKKDFLNHFEMIDLNIIKSELKDALEDGEFYYPAGWVRNFNKFCPEDSGFLVPMVNFIEEKNLIEELTKCGCNNVDIKPGLTLIGTEWHFVEMHD